MNRDIIAMVIGQHFADDSTITYDDMCKYVNKIENAFNESKEPYASTFTWSYICENNL